MSNRIEITGPISQPETRFTPQNKQVLSFRINATTAEKDQSSGQWSDVGAPLWVTVDLWEDTAKHYASLTSGDRVTVEGALIVEEYQKRDGTSGTGFKIRFPRVKGVIPRSQAAPGQATTGFGGPTYQQPTTDAWATPGSPQHTTEAPF